MTAPILFAMEEFPELHEIVEQGFDDPLNVKTVRIASAFFFERKVYFSLFPVI